MEGPLFVIKSWALAALGLWLYRRFFERMGKSVPEFEAWSRTEPLLAALHGNEAALTQIEAALLKRLGKSAELVATLGGWPWPYYALSVHLVRRGSVLELRLRRAELRRSHGTPPPSLVAVLRDTLNDYPDTIHDAWLHSGTVFGKPGADTPSEGWQLHAGTENRPKLVAREQRPSWLPKFLDFPGKC